MPGLLLHTTGTPALITVAQKCGGAAPFFRVTAPPNRTFSDDGNVLYPAFPILSTENGASAGEGQAFTFNLLKK